MALSLVIVCDCGKPFSVYVPKQKLFGEILGDLSLNWEDIDKEEEADGEIELARHNAANLVDAEFIDGRETVQISCSCGGKLDLARTLARMKKSIDDALPRDHWFN